AQLRHGEVMELHLRRSSETAHDPKLENLVDLSDLPSALKSMRKMENLRRGYEAAGDKQGLQTLRAEAIEAKRNAVEFAAKKRTTAAEKAIFREAAEWITLWLQSPQLFENWLDLRRASPKFTETFGKI
ncbi:MAG: hypothetical protein LC734_05540, partial [Acidobacteria bacterium]|nr:hypothetical protein [Acidobacteriota bacterium]